MTSTSSIKSAAPQVGRGIRSIADAAAKCSAQSLAYGKCITENYKDVHKDMCAQQFSAFKACLSQHLKRKW